VEACQGDAVLILVCKFKTLIFYFNCV
jgi:hypothetical protein